MSALSTCLTQHGWKDFPARFKEHPSLSWDGETFQFEEGSCLFSEVAEPQLSWNGFFTYVWCQYTKIVVCGESQIHSSLCHPFYKAFQVWNKKPKREGMYSWWLPRSVLANYCTESINFVIWWIWTWRTTRPYLHLGNVWHLQRCQMSISSVKCW